MARRTRCDLGKEALWRDRLADQGASGLTIAEWCRRNGVAGPLFHYWKRTMARRGAGGARRRPPFPARPNEPALFARVVLATPLAPIHPESLPADGSIEIVLSGGRAVRVGSGFDAAALARVLDVLEGRPC